MVNSSRLAVAFVVLMPVCGAFAGVSTRPTAPKAQVTSPGVALGLTEDVEITIPGTQMPFYLINASLQELQHSPDAGCVSVDSPTCEAPR